MMFEKQPSGVLVARTCHTCGVLKDAKDFSVDRRNRLGRNMACKPCSTISAKLWQANNRQLVLDRQNAKMRAGRILARRYPEEFAALRKQELDAILASRSGSDS